MKTRVNKNSLLRKTEGKKEKKNLNSKTEIKRI